MSIIPSILICTLGKKYLRNSSSSRGTPRRNAPRAWIRETLLKNTYVLVTVIFMAWTTRYANHRTMFLTSTAIRECVVCVCTE